jgi:hypothetical protein
MFVKASSLHVGEQICMCVYNLFSFDLQHLDYCFSHCKKNECLFL